MSLEAILLLVILGVVLAIFFLRNRNSSGSDSLLLQLNEALRNEIQEIRKDVAQNAQTSRVEIEGKLKTINLIRSISVKNIKKHPVYVTF